MGTYLEKFNICRVVPRRERNNLFSELLVPKGRVVDGRDRTRNYLRIEFRKMKSEPLVALYPAYLQPQLIEVFCFSCHRLIGATPRVEVAELLRRMHVAREMKRED